MVWLGVRSILYTLSASGIFGGRGLLKNVTTGVTYLEVWYFLPTITPMNRNLKIYRMYAAQIRHSKVRKHPQPTYSFEQFKDWIESQLNWEPLYTAWETSGFIKNLAPSADRKNSLEPYNLDNLQLVTWLDNMENYRLERKKPVDRYSLTGEFMGQYVNVYEAGKKNNVASTAVYRCVVSKYGVLCNSLWKYSGSDKEIKVKPEDLLPTPVNKLSLIGTFICQYPSMNRAALDSNTDTTDIRKVCEGRGKTCGGFRWEYADEALREKVVEAIKQRESKKIVEQYDLDGVFMREWASPLEVKKVLGISIHSSLEKENSTVGGYQWKYKNGGKIIKAKVLLAKKVEKFSLTGDFIETFVSSRDALKTIDGTMKGLKKCLWGEKKSYKGFIWRYA